MSCGCENDQPVGGMYGNIGIPGAYQTFRILRSDADPVCVALDADGTCINFENEVAAMRSEYARLGVIRAVVVV